jgi:hypothetical protein
MQTSGDYIMRDLELYGIASQMPIGMRTGPRGQPVFSWVPVKIPGWVNFGVLKSIAVTNLGAVLADQSVRGFR